MEISKRSFFNPIKLTAAQKAAGTHETAMRIIDDEVTAREPKLRDFASCGRPRRPFVHLRGRRFDGRKPSLRASAKADVADGVSRS